MGDGYGLIDDAGRDEDTRQRHRSAAPGTRRVPLAVDNRLGLVLAAVVGRSGCLDRLLEDVKRSQRLLPSTASPAESSRRIASDRSMQVRPTSRSISAIIVAGTRT
jgi:hypothetical protein